tara:strand:+ start:119 stop:748 length:630 start_codon:yes stop_codon:yes gene_type:complete
MFALVEDGSITKYFNGNRGFTLNGNQYPRSVFTLWTKSEREAIGIYEVEMDTSKRKNEKWYQNTNVSYAFGSGKVTGSYGNATAKPHADTLWTQQDSDDGLLPPDTSVGDLKAEGLKTTLIRDLKKKAANILAETDWYIVRKADATTAIPSAITNHRAAVRTKCAEMETAITNAADTPALETLYTPVNTGTEENPVWERPLGELPTLEV